MKSKTMASFAAGAFMWAAMTTPIGAQEAGTEGDGAPPPSGPFEIVAEGLNNPRQLAIDGDAVVVAEAGIGGDGACIISAEGNEQCFGTTGSVTLIDADGQQRVMEGLPSIASADGGSASGPQGIAIEDGIAHIAIGLGSAVDLAGRDAFGPDGADFGSLISVDTDTGGEIGSVDLLAFETANNPDGGGIDVNPFGVAVRDGEVLVADAGANAVFAVSGDEITTEAAFPPLMVAAPPFLELPPGTEIPMQAVPTGVDVADGGDLLVSQLTGFPFPIGGANVFRVPASGGDPTVEASGFTNLSDVAVGPDGSIWVLSVAKDGLGAPEGGGSLSRISPSGDVEVVADEGLFFPSGLAISDSGEVYVTNCGVCAGGGQVLRLVQTDDTTSDTTDQDDTETEVGSDAAPQADDQRVAYASGRQEVPASGADGWSWSVWRIRDNASHIDFSMTLFDVSDVQAMHLHWAPAGENGPVVANLTDMIESDSRAEGSITADMLVGQLEGLTVADLVTEIDAGRIYVNVHTTDNRGGEIRGILVTG